MGKLNEPPLTAEAYEELARALQRFRWSSKPDFAVEKELAELRARMGA